MEHFTIRELMLVVTAVCLWLGGYSLGSNRAERRWHLHGYAEAEDHYQVMLSSFSECKQTWDSVGELWRKNPNMTIIGEPLDSEADWQAYVQYHSQRNGWKDASVFKRLENLDRERDYKIELSQRPECVYPDNAGE